MSEHTPPNKYGTTPYIPTDAHNIGEEPQQARLTKSLVWVLLGLHIVTFVLGLVSMQSQGATAYFEQMLPPGELQQVPADMIDTIFTASLAFFIGFAVVTVVLFVIVGLGLRANRNWARFMGLVLGILFILSAVYTLVVGTDYGNLPPLELANTIVSVLIVLITVWWCVQALHKKTAAWFVMHRTLQG